MQEQNLNFSKRLLMQNGFTKLKMTIFILDIQYVLHEWNQVPFYTLKVVF